MTRKNVSPTVTFGEILKGIQQFSSFESEAKGGTAIVIGSKSHLYSKIAKEQVGKSDFRLKDNKRQISNPIHIVDKYKGGQ